MLFNPDKPERHAASYAAVKAMEPLSRNTDSVGSFQAAAAETCSIKPVQGKGFISATQEGKRTSK